MRAKCFALSFKLIVSFIDLLKTFPMKAAGIVVAQLDSLPSPQGCFGDVS